MPVSCFVGRRSRWTADTKVVDCGYMRAPHVLCHSLDLFNEIAFFEVNIERVNNLDAL